MPFWLSLCLAFGLFFSGLATLFWGIRKHSNRGRVAGILLLVLFGLFTLYTGAALLLVFSIS